MTPAQLSLGIVIPTCGRPASLLRALRSLDRQQFPLERVHVVVVADGGLGDAADSVRRLAPSFRLDILEQPRLGAAAARNRGAAAVSGELLLFLDDDMEAEPGLLAAHARAHAPTPGERLVVGAPVPVVPKGARLTELHVRDWWLRQLAAMERGPLTFRDTLTGNLSLSAATFRRLGGFDETLREREDWEFGWRALAAGLELVHAPEARSLHHLAMSAHSWLERGRMAGQADARLAALTPAMAHALPLTESARGAPAARLARRAAYDWARAADAVAGALRPVIFGAERLRLRRTFLSLGSALRLYGYWRGVADEARSAAGDVVRERTPGRASAEEHPFLATELPAVSVVIPAFNAAETLGDALESLRRQTHGHWEAVVVDDGSTDGTADVAARLSARDDRIRLVLQDRAGVGAARNRGLAEAAHPWVVFLDSDDWLLPDFLDRLGHAVAETPETDLVYCGWQQVNADGSVEKRRPRAAPSSIVEALGKGCPFVIHACMVRRSAVMEVGGFDPGLAVGEDWDLWSRLARAGARFAQVDDVLAANRRRVRSASTDPAAFLAGGLAVLERLQAPDPRVPRPAPGCETRLPAVLLTPAELACYPAALAIGTGGDASAILARVPFAPLPGMDPERVAWTLFEGVAEAAALPPGTVWPGAFDELAARVETFLQDLEARADAPYLARRAMRALERCVISSEPRRPFQVGATLGIAVEATEPIEDVAATAERLLADVTLEGRHLGTLHLPMCDGVVPAPVLRDALTEHTWAILGAFLERSIYPQLELRAENGSISAWRGEICIVAPVAEDETTFRERLHDRAGWTVFLQELWGRPDWPEPRFYQFDFREVAEAAAEPVAGSDVVVELSGTFPALASSCEPALRTVTARIGGAAVGWVEAAAGASAQELRAAISAELGVELCRAAVREALIGRPLAGDSLRTRLQERAAATGAAPTGADAATQAREQALSRALPGGVAGVVIGRRPGAPASGSAARFYAVPTAAAQELIAAAEAAGQRVVARGGTPLRVIVTPELPPATSGEWRSSAAGPPAPGSTRRAYDRHYFEGLFAEGHDPWRYATPYERRKYEQTLELIPQGCIRRALEVGCAEGVFTASLAPRVDRLVAADISQLALTRAGARCSGLDNVDFLRLDIAHDPLPGTFDLIVCSEVLYFLSDVAELQAVAGKLVAALEPGGTLVSVHANTIADAPDEVGYDWDVPFGGRTIGNVFEQTPGLRLEAELKTELYRVRQYRRASVGEPARSAAPRVLLRENAPPPPHAAARVRRPGSGATAAAPSRAETWKLPILMYHRVADGGQEAGRYRVTPDAFRAQLSYLRDAGFYGIRLDDWRKAAHAHRPLPGRAVLLTFDDGFADFLDAWALLKEFGFPATMFLPTGHLGGVGDWEDASADIELLHWEQVRRLHAEGVEFGSHTVGHVPLDGMDPADIVREAVRSRAAIEHELGAPVTALAYPYGTTASVAQHLVGACGYLYGLTVAGRPATFRDSALALPRIEVSGTDDLDRFVAKLVS